MSGYNITKIAVAIAAASTIACVLYIAIKKDSTDRGVLKENYDPQDMGDRNYWGFGREYGYPQRDMDIGKTICYQISPRHICRDGYSRRINSITMGDECCVNNYVYGS